MTTGTDIKYDHPTVYIYTVKKCIIKPTIEVCRIGFKTNFAYEYIQRTCAYTYIKYLHIYVYYRMFIQIQIKCVVCCSEFTEVNKKFLQAHL